MVEYTVQNLTFVVPESDIHVHNTGGKTQLEHSACRAYLTGVSRSISVDLRNKYTVKRETHIYKQQLGTDGSISHIRKWIVTLDKYQQQRQPCHHHQRHSSIQAKSPPLSDFTQTYICTRPTLCAFQFSNKIPSVPDHSFRKE